MRPASVPWPDESTVRQPLPVTDLPLRPETCVGAVVMQADHLLLIRRGRGAAEGQWSIPGGRVERGETLAEAVVREVEEETGLVVVCRAFLGWVERISAQHHFVILDFVAEVARVGGGPDVESGLPLLRAGDDAADAAWVALAELATIDLVDGLYQFLVDHGLTPPTTDPADH
jgi:8-oxo-dGTP diphosphatase